MVTIFSVPVVGSTFPRSEPIRMDSVNQNDMLYLRRPTTFRDTWPSYTVDTILAPTMHRRSGHDSMIVCAQSLKLRAGARCPPHGAPVPEGRSSAERERLLHRQRPGPGVKVRQGGLDPSSLPPRRSAAEERASI